MRSSTFHEERESQDGANDARHLARRRAGGLLMIPYEGNMYPRLSMAFKALIMLHDHFLKCQSR